MAEHKKNTDKERIYHVSGAPVFEGVQHGHPRVHIPTDNNDPSSHVGHTSIINLDTNESVEIYGVNHWQWPGDHHLYVWPAVNDEEFHKQNLGEKIKKVVTQGSTIKVTTKSGSSEGEHGDSKTFPKESAVLISDMSGFTANVRKYGVNHVASLILKQREVLKPIWEAYGALDIWYEADNNWCTFPNVEGAVNAAIEAGRIIKEYNSNIKPGFELLIAGFGIDSGDEVIKNLHEGKIFGPSVDTAFFLGEDVVTKVGILVSERAWNTVREHPSLAKLTVAPGEEKGVKYVNVSGEVANPLCKLHPPSQDKSTPLQLLTSRATFPDTAAAVDAEINSKFISTKTAMFFGFEGQTISKKYGLPHYLKVANQLEGVISKIFLSFKGAEKEIFNYWLFDDSSNAIRAVLTAKQAILAHNALCAAEDFWPVKGFGLHSSPMLRLPGTDICFGDAANTASKLSEDAGSNLSVYVTKNVMDAVGFIKGLKSEAQILSVSGVDLECYLVDLKLD